MARLSTEERGQAIGVLRAVRSQTTYPVYCAARGRQYPDSS